MLGMLGGAAYGADPGLSQDALQHQRDPDQPDAGLCRPALPRLAGARPLARSAGLQLPADGHIRRLRPAGSCRWPAAPTGASSSPLVAVVGAVVLLAAALKGFEVRVLGQSPRAGRFAGFSPAPHGLFVFLVSGALAGLAGISRSPARSASCSRSISPGYGFTAIIVAFLGRLNPLGIVVAGLVLALSYLGGEAAQIALELRRGGAGSSRACCCSSCSPATRSILYRVRARRPRGQVPGGRLAWSMLRSDPADHRHGLDAAADRGDRRTGGRALRRAQSRRRGHDGRWARSRLRRRALDRLAMARRRSRRSSSAWRSSLLFAVPDADAGDQPGGDRPGADLLGSAFPACSARLRRPAGATAAQSRTFPGLSDIPLVGRLLFGQDPIFYLSLALVAAVAWFLFRTRAGLTLRAVGDNHGSAHALGIRVIGIRYLAVMFGGACAGLAGAHLSLVYTPQWVENMTAGRGWIALALVVFASWRPWRAAGRRLSVRRHRIGQLHIQAITQRSRLPARQLCRRCPIWRPSCSRQFLSRFPIWQRCSFSF